LPRYLALDWDHQQLHVVEATIGGGAVRVQRAVVWDEAEVPTVAGAEALGKKLRERMKEARISAAPVLMCVGRDRVIVKEVRYPEVPAVEEPAVVRFQTIKELTDAPEDAVIDYIPLPQETSAASSERRAIAVVAKREQIEAYQALCKAAGLKLVGITPRSFGMAACAHNLAGASVLTPAVEPPDAPMAVLAVADHWAEMCISRSGNVVFARSLVVGDLLPREARRNLALFDGQSSGNPVRAFYVAGMGEHAALRERLQHLLEIPVHTVDPFGGAERPELPSQKRGAFIGAVGLIHAQGGRHGLPINFAKPKQPRPPSDPNRKKQIYAAVLAALVLFVGVAFGWAKLADLNSNLAGLQRKSEALDRELIKTEEDAKRIRAIRDWADPGLVVLDEMYDLADRISDPTALRVTEITIEPLQRTGKEKAVSKLNVKGVAKTKLAVDDLANGFANDKHYDVGAKSTSENTGSDKTEFAFTFVLPVKVEKRSPEDYQRQLPAPPAGGSRGFGR
jgi:Tfp pilus assembly PilM family ATPase